MIERIQARRDELAAMLAESQRQYDELETTLHALDRQLCAMHGGLKELDLLLVEGAPEHISTYETGLNGAHAQALDARE